MDERGDACAQCGYSLYGLPGLRCPECGLENLDPEEVRRAAIAWFCSWRGLLLTRPPLEWGRAAAERTVRRAAWRRVLLVGVLPWLILWGEMWLLSHVYVFRTYDRGVDHFSTQGPALADYGRKAGFLIELEFAWREPYVPQHEVRRAWCPMLWTAIATCWIVASTGLIEFAGNYRRQRWRMPGSVAMSLMAFPSGLMAGLIGAGVALAAPGIFLLDVIRPLLALSGLGGLFVFGLLGLHVAQAGWRPHQRENEGATGAFIVILWTAWVLLHSAAIPFAGVAWAP